MSMIVEMDNTNPCEFDLDGVALYPVTITLNNGTQLIGSMSETEFDELSATEIVRRALADGDTWMRCPTPG